MAQARIGVEIYADGRGFKSGLNAVEKTVTGFARSVGGMLAGVFSVAALSQYVRQTIRWANETWDAANALGVTFEEMQKLSYAAEKTGAEIGNIKTALKEASKFRLAAITNPKGKEAGIAKALGLGTSDLQGMTSSYDAFNKLAKAIQVSNLGVNELAVATEVFGRGAVELMPAIKEGFSALAREASAIGTSSNQIGEAWDTIGDKITVATTKMRNFTLAQALALVNILGDNKIGGAFRKFTGTPGATKAALKEKMAAGSKTVDSGELERILATPASATKALNFTPPSDALAKIGGFIGGAGVNRPVQIAQQQLQKLDRIEDILTRITLELTKAF